MISPYAWVGMIERPRPGITDPQEILRQVANCYNLTVENLKRRCRERELVEARQIAMYLMREISPSMPLTKIGHLFKFDHTTVMHSIKTVKNLLAVDADFKDRFARCRSQVLRLSSIGSFKAQLSPCGQLPRE